MATDPPITSYSEFLKALLSDRERFFEEVVEGVALRSKLRYAVVTIIALSGFFGLVAGAYSGPAQAVSAGVKLPFLFFATFAVCFPAFFVVQVLVGSRLRLLQVVVLVFGALALTSVLLDQGLADEVVLAVYPVLLGRGKRFFSDSVGPRELALVSTQAFPSGIVLNTYKVAGPLKTG